MFKYIALFCILGLLFSASLPAEAKVKASAETKLVSYNKRAHKLLAAKKYDDVIKLLVSLKDSEHNYLSYYSLGQAYRLNKDYDKALASYKKSVLLFDDNVKSKDKALVHSGIGFVYSKLKKHDLAIVDYLESLDYLPNNYIVLVNLGKNYLRLKDYNSAIKYFNRALEIKHGYTNAIQGLARVYFETRDYKKSTFFYKKLKELSPNNKDAYFGLAYNLERLGKKKLAYKMFADAYFIARDYKKSVFYIKKLSHYRKDSKLYILLISSYIYLKKYQLAKHELNKAIKKYPKHDEFVFTKAQLFFITKQYRLSAKIAKKGLVNFPSSNKLNVILGHSYLKLKKKENAIRVYNKALKIQEDDIATREHLAHIYRKDGKKNLEFYHQGVAYFFLGDYDQSFSVLSWIDKKTFASKSALAYYKGMVLWAMKKQKDALLHFTSSINENKGFYLAYIALARAYSSLQKKNKALSTLMVYIKRYPKSRHTKELNKLYKDIKTLDKT